ncbi:MAG: tRNA dihydrouridine synthase DusB [Bacillota bacterium]
MRIGDLYIAEPVALAPMAGVTDLAYRRICRRFTQGLLFTEMINARALTEGNARSVRNALVGPIASPQAAQLIGSNPGIMASAARVVVEMGADVVDINMGCPVPKVVKKGEGAAMMKHLDLAQEIVAAVTGAVSVPVTAKIRSGWDETSINAPEMAALLADAGAAAIVVHARTREALYGGKADWSVIRRVRERISVPLIGNGDLRSPQDALAMVEATGCDGVMVGRAALGNPWILRQVCEALDGREITWPSPRERVGMALEHAEEIRHLKGDHIALLEMRKHAAWYTRGLPGAAKTRAEIHWAPDIETMKSILLERLEVT